MHVFELFKTFRQGCKDLENNSSSGQHSAAQNEGAVAIGH
jgi:hypothetical protein